MKKIVRYSAAGVLLLVSNALLLAGCHDQTQTPQNQAINAKRQAIILQHKSDN